MDNLTHRVYRNNSASGVKTQQTQETKQGSNRKKDSPDIAFKGDKPSPPAS